jgi:hypothetical protein
MKEFLKTEEQCKPSERYLFADAYFADNAISFWKSECIRRCNDKPKGQAYERFINWQRNENEIAVFTLYAYADFSIPKSFDTIFQTDKPDNFIKTNYELIQSIHEAWLPLDTVDDGHKHLCIFRFDNKIPDILYLLHEENEKISTASKGQKKLGFCNSKDFEYIQRRTEKTLNLKVQYGNKWWEHDDGE